MEFDESRPYQPGDDPRSIDWRVTARSTTAYTKLFREERERPVLIAVDLRSNMHFATQGCFKSVNASRAAAHYCRGRRIIAVIAWAGSSSVTRLTGNSSRRLGRRAALRFVHELVEHPDWHQRDIRTRRASTRSRRQCLLLRRVARPGSALLLLLAISSVFRVQHSPTCRAWRSHNEVLAVFLNDPDRAPAATAGSLPSRVP